MYPPCHPSALLTTFFFSHKYSRGSPHCWYINSNKINCTERKGDRERTTVYRLYNCTEREGKKRTAGGSQPWSPKEDRKVALLESQSLWACNLASSTKFCFQETREGRPRSNIELFLCFHIYQAPMMKISMKKVLENCCLAWVIIRKKSAPRFQCMSSCCQ